MSFRTTCPACASVFRLGADQLDAAQGWVQCSVCGAAFDAHPSLLMEDGSPLVTEPDPEPEIAAAPQPSAFPFTKHHPDEVRAIEQAALEVAIPSGITQRESALELPSIILIDPDIPTLEDDFGPLPQFEVEPAPPAAPIFTVTEPPAARIEYAPPRPDIAPVLVSAPRRVKSWVWTAGSALLLVVLLAQTGYFLRDTLVGRLPQARPAFEQACAVLGCMLSLPQDPALLQIIGSDLQTEASGRLKLTLTLGNRASQAQAWPMLVLTLTDQRERPLARRSFAPSEYLGDPQRITAGIPPRSEQPLSLPLTVRDITPMGFDLQLRY